MKYRFSKRKKIALFLLLIWTAQVVCPPVVQALTSGPVQPEVQGFSPAGVSDMVDLKTGDMKYNIPLLDIDGYPINLNYQSGMGMEDEASWVGFGWNLNMGSINRQVRGLPDDMKGDPVITEHYTKPKVTVSAKGRVKSEIGGSYVGLDGTLSVGMFSDNYTGIGAELGVNAGISVSIGNDGPLTAGLGVGILSSTATGVDVTPYANLGIKTSSDHNITTNAGLSASLGYNSRSGLKSKSLGASFGMTLKQINQIDDFTSSFSSNVAGSSISYNTEPILPKISFPYKSTYGSFSLDVGASAYVFFSGIGGTGSLAIREVASPSNTNGAYGFLYADQGKARPDAVMDFIREKENPVIPELPNLALPVSTPDLFTFTSQAGSGEFRLYREGTGAYFDNEVSDKNTNTTLGFDYGYGLYFHGGVTEYHQKTTNTTRKWTANNQYIAKGDFQAVSATHPEYQHVGFRVVGEKTLEDPTPAYKQNGADPLAVEIGSTNALNKFSAQTTTLGAPIEKQKRQLQHTSISYLTALEASQKGLDKKIISYLPNIYNAAVPFQPPANHKPVVDPAGGTIQRNSGLRLAHHLSEMTVTDGQGKRMVYGLPVYNNFEQDYSFAIGSGYTRAGGNLDQVSMDPLTTTKASLGKNKGIDNYYHLDSHPAYASSFLLTAILSPDYVDMTQDGITADDLGTALKFNYSKATDHYQWRTPYTNATINRCLLADKDDDKASIVYGDKELWYANSVESKTKIAYFITEDRFDGLGVNGFAGGQNKTVRQKRLKEIRLYSRADMSKPIKVVVFDYDYSTCPQSPNSDAPATQGKLTLKSVHFEYGGVTKGKYFPYKFTYNSTYANITTGTPLPVNYISGSADRWGMHREAGDLAPIGTTNEEFPYTIQNYFRDPAKVLVSANSAAGLFQLSSIALPTGGTINVTYESDDYAYVQDKQAMIMAPVAGLVNGTGPNAKPGLVDADGFTMNLANETGGAGDATEYFKNKYLNGSPYIYTKFSVKIANNNSAQSTDINQQYDFVPSYSKIQSVTISTDGVATIKLEKHDESGVKANPIIFSAWQRIKEEYPRYAYSGFDRRVGDGLLQNAESAVMAMVSTFANLSELKENFYQKASRKYYSNIIRPNMNFARIVKPDGFKLGGGSRVNKIMITDAWNAMGGSTDAQTRSYGQGYTYTMQEGTVTKSSGVASYEPSVGNDENPLKQPVFYTQQIRAGIDNVFNLDEPFGESFFPAPQVVYSKVTVTDLDPSTNPYPLTSPGPTGYQVSEFYTAKDYPVFVSVSPMQKFQYKPPSKSSVIESSAIDELTLSQGYAIELNDMHGKPKATHNYNQAGVEIASETSYYYGTSTKTVPMKLKNEVTIVKKDGSVEQNKVIGRDIEFFTDFREQESTNDGQTYNVGVDVVPAFNIPLPIPHFPVNNNSEYKLFRSACAVKVTQTFGIIDSVVKVVNGSHIRTENLAFDGATGQPVVTRTQNEFNQDIYSLSIPAYWAYKGMGPAYQNAGMIISGVTTAAFGVLPSTMSSYLQKGDEVLDLASGKSYWVVQQDIADFLSPPGLIAHYYVNVLMDQYGEFLANANINVKVVRSGFRNMLEADVSNMVMLQNPIIPSGGGFRLAIDSNMPDLTAYKVINASAKTYDENWSTMPPDIHPVPNNTPYDLNVYFGTQNSPNGNQNVYIDQQAYTTGPISLFYGHRESMNMIGGSTSQPLYTPNDNNIMGIFAPYYIDTEGDYYIGYDSEPKLYFSLDSNCDFNSWYVQGSYSTATQRNWNMKKEHLLQGWHNMRIELTYSDANHDNRPNGAAIEIYKNTASELYIAGMNNGQGLNVVFSTKNLIQNPSVVVYTKQAIATAPYTQYFYNYQYNDLQHTVYSPCTIAPTAINPYLFGFVGNWRPYQSLVFQQQRNYASILTQNSSVVNVKSAGFINNIYSYWTPSGQNDWVITNSIASWIVANTVTLYDKYGQESENKDALKRFSAAKFDFNGEFPGAVASNAKNRDIYANSFEDTQFLPGTIIYADQKPNEFALSSNLRYINTIVQNNFSHTGNSGIAVTADSIGIKTNTFSVEQKTQDYLDMDLTRHFVKSTRIGLYPNGFEPTNGKDYLVDVWVKDSEPTKKTANLSLYLNGTLQAAMVCKAVVEDWKLLEGKFSLKGFINPNPVNITFYPLTTSTIYLDDLRIHPMDSHMKTYSYDATTLRLMAELDENAFATLYEYDSEGLLTRVKKETERGIMTIKESRSSQKKGIPFVQ
jgi:hypothetical protein